MNPHANSEFRNPKSETPRDPPGHIGYSQFSVFNMQCSLLLAAMVCGCADPFSASAQTLANALDDTNLVWSTGGLPAGVTNWFGQTATHHDGADAAQSGLITHNQTNWIETSVTGPGTVTFWWKVGSEGGWDKLRFDIGGVEQTNISGNIDWRPQSFAVPAGAQSLRWKYTKDQTVTTPPDAGWVDDVEYSPAPPQPHSLITVPEGATATITTDLRGTARLVNQGTLTNAAITLSDSTGFDNDGNFWGNCLASDAVAIINRGRIENAFLNLNGADVSVRNEGTFAGGFINLNAGRILNMGVMDGVLCKLDGSACFTNEGVAVGATLLYGQSVMVNRGAWAGSIRLSAAKGNDVKLWSSGTLTDATIEADTFSTNGTGSITVDISGGGSVNWIDLFANTVANTNPPPSTRLSFTCSAGTNLLRVGSLTTGTAGTGKVSVTNALQSQLQVDTLTTSGNTRFKNDGTLAVSNLTVGGSSLFVQSGSANVASALFSGVSQSQINGPTAMTNLTLEGNLFFQHNTNMRGSTMQINATNGSNLGFQNNGLLQYDTLRMTVNSPGNNGFIRVQNNGTFDCDELILLDNVPLPSPGLSDAGPDLITFNNAGTIAGRLFSASTAGIGQVDINNWGNINPEQFVTNGNVQIWNDQENGIAPQATTWDLPSPGSADVAPLNGETRTDGPTPMDAGVKSSDAGMVLVPAGKEATFGGEVYGTMVVSNQGFYVIADGLRLFEQSSLGNAGTIEGGEVFLSGQSTITNTGTMELTRLQVDTVAGDSVAVRNSGQLHVAELVLSKEAAGGIECGPAGLIEISAAWLGQALIAPFTLTNGQSLALGGVNFTTHGSGIIRVASPPLALVSPARTGTNFCFWFQTQSNLSYTVEYNDDLRTTNWEHYCTMSGDGLLMQCLIPRTNTTQRFFRVREP